MSATEITPDGALLLRALRQLTPSLDLLTRVGELFTAAGAS